MTNINNYEWAEDPKARDVLDELGLRYSKRTVSLGAINWTETNKNCGRFGFNGVPYSQENIEDYSLAMKKGDRFPMPVLGETKQGLVVAAGVHRSKAAELAGMKEITCYVFQCDLPHHLRMVAILTNRKEGVRVSQAEAMQYALELVTKYNLVPKDVARHLGVSEGTLTTKMRIAQLRSQLAKLGFRGDLTDSVVRNFTTIATRSDKVFLAIAQLAHKASLSDNDSRELVDKLKLIRNEQEQLDLIAKEEESRKRLVEAPTQTGIPNPISFPIRTKFLKALRSLNKLLEGKESLADLQITSEDYDHVRNEWNTLRKVLSAITK